MKVGQRVKIIKGHGVWTEGMTGRIIRDIGGRWPLRVQFDKNNEKGRNIELFTEQELEAIPMITLQTESIEL